MGITPAALQALIAGDMENFIAASTPGGIEAQEAQGQRDMVAKALLPKDGPWPALEALGVAKGSEEDDLFYRATLPEGWQIVPTDHSMWSQLVDDTGTERAAIFYKAAFYDRTAQFRLTDTSGG